MQYDPIKKSLGWVFNQTPFLRKMFYRLLDLLLLRSWHIRSELRRWKAYAGDNVQILDAGSGFGQYVYRMSRMDPQWQITGVDVKADQIDDCNRFFRKIGETHRVGFYKADLQKYRQENAYDLVLSVDVMEHIPDDVAVFKNIYASLKNGGMLLLSTPSDYSEDVHDEKEAAFVDEHVRDGYNINDIQQKLRKAGFQVVEARYTYGKPGKIAWKLSMKYPLVMLNVTQLLFILLPFYYLFTYPVAYYLNKKDLKGSHPSGSALIVKAHKREQ